MLLQSRKQKKVAVLGGGSCVVEAVDQYKKMAALTVPKPAICIFDFRTNRAAALRPVWHAGRQLVYPVSQRFAKRTHVRPNLRTAATMSPSSGATYPADMPRRRTVMM
jgi:hypothetical protein